MPTLYVVATPIGNLEDISLRALRTLREVKLIAAEDTRKTKRLLETYDIKTPVTSYYEHNKRSKLGYILERLREEDVAIVSEAGVPCISDPGYELVVAASRQGIAVVPIPGASAVTAALSVSGLATDRFTYIGFLPRKTGERKRLLESMIAEPSTIIALEAPHRLRESLEDIMLVLGNKRIAVCRQLTKMHEEVFRGTIAQALEHFDEPKGEFTLVIEGCSGNTRPKLTLEAEKQLERMRISGAKAKEAIAAVAGQTGLSKKELYRAWLRSSQGVKGV
ncbi:MAG TPA: 16S rRNA (cytidine(1402)-2'-O)-methyltransferase [Dehalococcoidia bacterium]|nr:16S rRNA (cytidine(1402)-2'-O)-methyltransferase [Dehalococcoidia bacterium]